MKFREIFRFEFSYQVRSLSNWLFALVVLVISFLLTTQNFVSDAMMVEFFINSPFVVAMVTVFVCMVWILVGGSTAGEATARDIQTRMHPLCYTQPVSKVEYLGGKFLAVLTINLMVILVANVGILIGTYLIGNDPEIIGPVQPFGFINAFLYIAFPDVFVATALQFAFSTLGRKATVAYVASMFIFFSTYVVSVFSIGFLKLPEVAYFSDVIGVINVVSDIANNWTPYEKSHRLLQLDGYFLLNRILWITIGILALGITYWQFGFRHYVERKLFSFRKKKFVSIEGVAPQAIDHRALYDLHPTFNLYSRLRTLIRLAFISYRRIAFSWLGLVIWTITGLAAFIFIPQNMELDSIPQLAKPELVITYLSAPLSKMQSPWVIIPLLMLLYTGELVWREREAGLGELSDTTPVPEWILFLGKFFALTMVLISWLAILFAAGLLIQVRMGYPHFDLPLFFKVLFGFQLVEYMLFVVLALAAHTVINQKYIAHLVVLVMYVFIVLSGMLGIPHKMLLYGTSPAWSYTEMRGFGTSIAPWLWFKLYWSAWALLLVVATKLFWVRGKDLDFKTRVRIARGRFTKSTAALACAFVILLVATGGYVFYNIHIRNHYVNASNVSMKKASYEKKYGQYRYVDQPVIATTKLNVDIFPDELKFEIHGSYHLVNKTDFAIDSVHVENAGEVTTVLSFDQRTTLVVEDSAFHHHIYKLENPLQPGDHLTLNFEVRYRPHGFTNYGVESPVLQNGTKFSSEALPVIGYQPMRELMSPADRRRNKLPQRAVIPLLNDPNVHGRKGDFQRINVESVISTKEGQTAIGPGSLVKQWTDDGRNYYQYATSEPMSNGYDIFSAKYDKQESVWTDSITGKSVKVQQFYHPGHIQLLEKMKRSVHASLSFDSKHFGSYKYDVLRLIEVPGSGSGMHAEPMDITYPEGFSLWNPSDNPQDLDLIFGIVSHEVGHQFQAPYAFAEGAVLLSESFAWHASMGVMESTYGKEHLRRLLRFMREPYPYAPIKMGVPLLRALDPYLGYRKGPFAFYALSEYMGREKVDSALHVFLDNHKTGEAPRPTTTDMFAELKKATPDSLQTLLHDLFEENTFWELKSDKATVKQIDSTTWEVSLQVHARKIVVDETGTETERPIVNEWMDIGVFENLAVSKPPLYLAKHKINSGLQTITIKVKSKEKPVRAAIDPFHFMIDIETDNNYRRLKTEDAGNK